MSEDNQGCKAPEGESPCKYEVLADESMSRLARFDSKSYKVYRIKAVRDIAEYSVKAGDIGGYVGPDEDGNYPLDHDGCCWIAGNSVVLGGRVSGSALVAGSASVMGSHLYDNSVVDCSARVYRTVLKGSSRVTGDATVLDSELCDNAEMRFRAFAAHAVMSSKASVRGTATVEGTEERPVHIGGQSVVEDNATVSSTLPDRQALELLTEGWHPKSRMYVLAENGWPDCAGVSLRGSVRIAGSALVRGSVSIYGNVLVDGDAAVSGVPVDAFMSHTVAYEFKSIAGHDAKDAVHYCCAIKGDYRIGSNVDLVNAGLDGTTVLAQVGPFSLEAPASMRNAGVAYLEGVYFTYYDDGLWSTNVHKVFERAVGNAKPCGKEYVVIGKGGKGEDLSVAWYPFKTLRKMDTRRFKVECAFWRQLQDTARANSPWPLSVIYPHEVPVGLENSVQARLERAYKSVSAYGTGQVM